MVTYAGRARDQIAEHYRSEENRAALKQVMRREKTLDRLLERAQGGDASAASTAPSESPSETPTDDTPAST